jgi:hypothetical protein
MAASRLAYTARPLLAHCHATAAAPLAPAPRACTASRSRVHTPALPPAKPAIACPHCCSTRACAPTPRAHACLLPRPRPRAPAPARSCACAAPRCALQRRAAASAACTIHSLCASVRPRRAPLLTSLPAPRPSRSLKLRCPAPARTSSASPTRRARATPGPPVPLARAAALSQHAPHAGPLPGSRVPAPRVPRASARSPGPPPSAARPHLARLTCCRMEERKGGRGERSATGGRRKGDAREKRNRGEREKRLPKDLCAISENQRDLSVKSNFPSI